MLSLTSPSPHQLNPVSLTIHVDAQQVRDTVTIQSFSQHTHITPSETSRLLIPVLNGEIIEDYPFGSARSGVQTVVTHVCRLICVASWWLSGHFQGVMWLLTTTLIHSHTIMYELCPASLARFVDRIYIIT